MAYGLEWVDRGPAGGKPRPPDARRPVPRTRPPVSTAHSVVFVPARLIPLRRTIEQAGDRYTCALTPEPVTRRGASRKGMLLASLFFRIVTPCRRARCLYTPVGRKAIIALFPTAALFATLGEEMGHMVVAAAGI